jgi:hypothetical protein
MAALVLLVMCMSGILGSYCRSIWEEDEKKVARNRIILPGIAAAMVVPLFLSVGGSSVFSQVFDDGSAIIPNIFLIAGFCVLAGVAAPNFVGALAEKALHVARGADQKAERAENIAEAAGEQAENAGLEAPNKNSADAQRHIEEISDPNQKMVLNALVNSEYTWRSVGGIAQATNLKRSAVRTALSALKSRSLVTDKISSKTNNPLYQARV